MRLVERADAHVIFLGTYPANVGDRKEDNPSSRLENDASRIVTTVLAENSVIRNLLISQKYLLASALHRRREAFAREGLQQVVHGVNFKCAQRVLVTRSSEDDVRHRHHFA